MKEMLTPYTSDEMLLDMSTFREKELFFRILSSVRQCVERLFGILQRKFYLLVSGYKYHLPIYIEFLFAIFNVHKITGLSYTPDCEYAEKVIFKINSFYCTLKI